MALSKKALRPLIAVVLAVALAIVWRVFFYGNNGPVDFISATGVMEATEVNISSKTAARVEWLCCAVGDRLKAGQKAATLDDAELKARVEEGRAALAGATESLNEAKVGLDNARAQSEAAVYETKAASAEVERTRALLKDAGDNLDRAKGLIQGGYITKKEMDSAETSFISAEAVVASAEARKKTSDANYRNSLAGIKGAEARISLASAKKTEAEASLKVLRSLLSDTVIASPIDGVVVYKAYETGEFVTPGASIYTVDDMNDMWARFDIEETDIGNVRLGDRAEIYPIGSPMKGFSGRVTEITEAGGFATQRDVTRGRSDIRTFSVKARVDHPEGFLKPRMTVTVRVYFGKGVTK